MNRKVKPGFCFQDERGKLVQLVHKDHDQVNVLFSKKGVLRGKHFHKISTESFYVLSGEVEVLIECDDTSERNVYGEGDFFKVYPNEIHSSHFNEDTWLVALYDKAIESSDGSKDIYVK